MRNTHRIATRNEKSFSSAYNYFIFFFCSLLSIRYIIVHRVVFLVFGGEQTKKRTRLSPLLHKIERIERRRMENNSSREQPQTGGRWYQQQHRGALSSQPPPPPTITQRRRNRRTFFLRWKKSNNRRRMRTTTTTTVGLCSTKRWIGRPKMRR